MSVRRIIATSLLLAGALPAAAQDCVDIEGEWEVTERVMLRCCVGGSCQNVSEEGTDFVFFQQNGCQVSYFAAGAERSGQITGNMIRLTGRLANPTPGLTITENVLDIRGTVSSTTMQLMGTGRLRGRIEGQNFECTVTTNATGRRDTPAPTSTITATRTATPPAPPTVTVTATPTASPTITATPSPTRTPTCGAPFGLESPVDPPNIVDGHLCGQTEERDEVGFKDDWQDADGDLFALSCEPDLRFHLTFAPAGGGPELLVGLCPWDEGRNFAEVLAGSDRRVGERYDCFQRSFWFSREPGLEQGLADTVDWIEYRYDVRTGRRTAEHWISADGDGTHCPDCKVCEAENADPLDFPPVADCAAPVPLGALASFCFRTTCMAGTAATGAADGLDAPPSGFMSGLEVERRCDINRDGTCDGADFALVRAAIGQCEGDARFLHTADADFDDCITGADVTTFFPRACFGDCNGNGAVTIDDLLGAVNVALGIADASTCERGDVNADGAVLVDELVRAVSAALNGCEG